MYQIRLATVPNQRLRVRIENALFEITLKTIGSRTFADLARDGRLLVQGLCCVPEKPLLPYEYLESEAGNFCFITDGSYPHFTRFGGSDVLLYLTRSELEEMRADK